MNIPPKITPLKEKQKITTFIDKTFKKNRVEFAVIGLSGGIDSMTSFYLLKEVIPSNRLIIAHLYYNNSYYGNFKDILNKSNIPNEHIYNLSIKKIVDEISNTLRISSSNDVKIRLGNIAARTRMVILFDLAKKYRGMVCGTENRSENLLGYFTRFGDQASDIEPICHLYKTQVYQLAKYLSIPDSIMKLSPSAGLWQGQTDEGQFGFTYSEADQVLYLNDVRKISANDLENMGYKNAKKILSWKNKNIFKHKTPYSIDST